VSQWDLTGSDGSPAESAQGRRVAKMNLHANQSEYLWREPNKTKQSLQPPTPTTSAPLPQGDALVAFESLKKESKRDEMVLEDALMPEMSVDR